MIKVICCMCLKLSVRTSSRYFKLSVVNSLRLEHFEHQSMLSHLSWNLVLQSWLPQYSLTRSIASCFSLFESNLITCLINLNSILSLCAVEELKPECGNSQLRLSIGAIFVLFINRLSISFQSYYYSFFFSFLLRSKQQSAIIFNNLKYLIII